MNAAGRLLQVYVPEFVRRRALRELFEVTADAFGVDVPELDRASADDLLESYATFTAAQAVRARMTGHDAALAAARLHEAAYGIGARLRRQLGIGSAPDAMKTARAVYRMLRIDLQPAASEVRIDRCFFSAYYSAAVCRLMSSLDQGLIAGLSGGTKLVFEQRITEGATCCVARLEAVSP